MMCEEVYVSDLHAGLVQQVRVAGLVMYKVMQKMMTTLVKVNFPR